MEPPQTSDVPQSSITENKKPVSITKSRWFRPAMIIIAIVVLALIALALSAQITSNTLPGESLYNFKTKVVEKVIRATKLSDSSKLDYTTALLEKRVAELLVLYSDESTSTPETLDRLASLTQQHSSDSVWMIENSNSLTPQEKITALSSITNTTRAFETLTDDKEEFATIKDYSSDIQNQGQDSLKNIAQSFASTSNPADVSAFVSEQINRVGEEITTVAENSRAQKLALTRIDDAGEYISEAKFGDAIYALLRARQAIAVDQYLYANERSGNGEAPNLDEIPEGS